MRRVRGESAEPREGVVEARQGVVKDRRETSELVLGILNRKPFAERLRGDLPRLVRHGADGREHAAGEDVAARERKADSTRDAHDHDDGKGAECAPERGLVDRDRDLVGGARGRLHAIASALRRRPRP